MKRAASGVTASCKHQVFRENRAGQINHNDVTIWISVICRHCFGKYPDVTDFSMLKFEVLKMYCTMSINDVVYSMPSVVLPLDVLVIPSLSGGGVSCTTETRTRTTLQSYACTSFICGQQCLMVDHDLLLVISSITINERIQTLSWRHVATTFTSAPCYHATQRAKNWQPTSARLLRPSAQLKALEPLNSTSWFICFLFTGNKYTFQSYMIRNYLPVW